MRVKQKRTLNEGDRYAVAFAHHSHCHLPAAPAGRQTAGITAFITPDGTTVIRFQCWARVVKHAQRLHQQGASLAQVAAYLTRKSRELEAKFGWLKKLWATRLQRVLLRKALQNGEPVRFDEKQDKVIVNEQLSDDTEMIFPRPTRSPPELSQPANTCLFVASPFVTPATPRSLRAPTFGAP